MLWINGKWVPIETALEVLALAREIARTEKLSHRDALRKALDLFPELDEDARQNARYAPARIILFDPTGTPRPLASGLYA